LLALVLLNIPLFITVIVTGRWTALTRRLKIALALVGCIFFAWTVLDGPVTLSPASDAMFKMALTLIIGITLITRAVQLYRGDRPAPN
jgi:hypothetical protein